MKSEFYESFLKSQEEGYSQIDDSLNNNVLVANKCVNGYNGYYICLKYSDDVSIPFAKISSKVSEHIESINYDKSKMHTSITHKQVFDEAFPDHDLIDRMIVALDKVKGNFVRPKIKIGGIALCKDALIAKGYPDEKFVNLAKLIVDSCNDEGLDLKMPWAAHMTLTKFHENKPKETLDVIKEIISRSDFPKEISPISLEVGIATHSLEEDFVTKAYKTYDLTGF